MSGPSARWVARIGVAALGSTVLIIAAVVLGSPGGQLPALADRPVPAAALTPTAAGVPCYELVRTLFSDDMAEVAAGQVGTAATREAELGARYGSNSAGWLHVQRVRDALLLTASDDLLNKFGRSVAVEVKAYEPRMRQLCTAPLS